MDWEKADCNLELSQSVGIKEKELKVWGWTKSCSLCVSVSERERDIYKIDILNPKVFFSHVFLMILKWRERYNSATARLAKTFLCTKSGQGIK